MKPTRQLRTRFCLVAPLALQLVGCVSVPQVQEQIQRIDIAADSYVVRAGDSWESIAFRYRLSPNELAGLNPEVGRQLVPGTPLTIRAASNVRDAYRTESAALAAADDSQAPVVQQRPDQAVTSPVVTQRAVPAAQQSQIEEPDNRTVYTPAVNAVVSDVTLLDPTRPYGNPPSSSSAQSGPAPLQAPQRAPARAPTPTMPADSGWQRPGNNGSQWAGREIIEEEYTGGTALPGQQIASASIAAIDEGWTWPTEGQVARGFAPVQEGRHGVDIAGVPGQPVVAVNDGVVAYSGRDPSGVGNLIIVRHDDSLLTAYSHTADLFVAENDTVSAGDPIATLGWNGRQESVLRFEVRRDGASVNPMDFLSMR